MGISSSFLADRITATEAQIVAYEDAILAFGTNNAAQSYTLDTGQTRQTVTRADLRDLNNTLNSLLNRLSTLCARRGNLNGDGTGGVINVVPAW